MNSMYWTCSLAARLITVEMASATWLSDASANLSKVAKKWSCPDSSPGAPVAHGPGVDDLVVEDMVAVSAADGGLGRVMLAGIAGRRYQLRGRAIDAEIVGGGEVDQVFGVNGAVKMVVEVCALGHLVQKGEQERGLQADGVEVTRGFLLGGLGSREDAV